MAGKESAESREARAAFLQPLTTCFDDGWQWGDIEMSPLPCTGLFARLRAELQRHLEIAAVSVTNGSVKDYTEFPGTGVPHFEIHTFIEGYRNEIAVTCKLERAIELIEHWKHSGRLRPKSRTWLYVTTAVSDRSRRPLPTPPLVSPNLSPDGTARGGGTQMTGWIGARSSRSEGACCVSTPIPPLAG